MKLNLIKMDSKGRISIPFHLRNLFGLKVGDKLAIDMTEKKEIVLVSGAVLPEAQKSKNIKIDSKGRIIVPYYIRDYLGLKEGIELALSSNENKLTIFPLFDGASRVSVTLFDRPGSLAKVLDIFAKHKCDIIISSGRPIERGNLAEWDALMDVSQCRNIKKLGKELTASGSVKKFRLDKGTTAN